MLQTAGEENPRDRESPDSMLLMLLQVQNQMKLYHWQTHSHARHRSTDDFVTEFAERLDHFVETYQGKYGRIRVGPGIRAIPLQDMGDDAGPVSFLRSVARFLTHRMPDYLHADQDTDLLNLRDEMLALVNQLKYLFTLR